MGEQIDPAASQRAVTPAEGAPGLPRSISRPKLLIGEGDAEQAFLLALPRHMKLTDIAVEHCGGKDNLRNYLHTLKTRAEFVRGDPDR